MESFTKRECELLSNLVLREAERLEESRKLVLIAAHKRVLREKENEMLVILRKLLTNNSSI